MPRLHRFRLERRASGERNRRHSELIKKRPPCKFSSLFTFSELSLPSELETFASRDKGVSDGDLSRNGASKIRVILKINEKADAPSCLTINKNQNCVGLIDPTPSRRSQTSNNNINLFPFDSIFTESDQQSKLLSSSIIDPILDFFKGKDACIFSFGNAGLGKTRTMIGSDQSTAEIGVIPCALVWIFKIIEQLKIKTKTRYSIRISAVEIGNKNIVRDLITRSTVSVTTAAAAAADSANLGVGFPEKHNTILNSQKMLPAGSLVEAARILDEILASRCDVNNDSLTHLQLIIHLYQYDLTTDKYDVAAVTRPVLGCRSRLYLLDLGSGRHGNDDSSILSLQGMSKVILALYTSQRHIPYKDNVLTQLLKETLGANTLTTMLVHISSKEQNYNDTLQIVQLASKLYRIRSRKGRSVGLLVSEETSSCSSSSSGFHSRRLRPHMGIGATRRSSGNSSASSEFDLTSASELSCCETVIFRGNTNISGSEKSSGQRSSKENPQSVSSESDLLISDKDSSKDYPVSSSAIRRRKISPRTNARAWPTINSGSNTNVENGPELWVDGPNAVYKSDRKNLKEHPNLNKASSNQKICDTEVSIPNSKKQGITSKESQSEDIWDSGSSLTDGSSHSNTLDRKDHRPLSDISECTEETESNVAAERGYRGINILNEICPEKDLDDFLESTFGISPLHQDAHQKISIKEIYSLKGSSHVLSSNPTPVEKENNTINKTDIISQSERDSLTTNNEEDKSANVVRSAKETRRHYHSASDSKRSTKSEQKERKSKSKCKKCSKKSSEETSTSLASSSSTDFSRVASWIRNVEYEIQTPYNDDVFIDDVKSFNHSAHAHHRSQPDISSNKDRLGIIKAQGIQFPIQSQFPSDNVWIVRDINHTRYSMYGNDCQMDRMTADRFLSHQNIHRNQITSVPTLIPCVPPVAPLSISAVVPPFQSPEMTRKHVQLSNLTNTRHSISTPRPPLPPLPKSEILCRDNRVSLTSIENPTVNYEGSLSSQVSRPPKCKTLPRDMYSDPISPLKRNKSDPHHSKAAQYKLQRITASQEIKSKEKAKKESKNIISILFAPFISLRNKISKGRCGSEKQTDDNENNTEKLFLRQGHFSGPIEPQWPLIDLNKLNPEFVLSSPYHLVTPPKTSTLPTESSGHGSDSSSLQKRTVKGRPYDISKQHKCRNKSSNNSFKNTSRQRPTSSGYGSIIIKGDSEVSSHNDSSSEYSISGQNHSRVVNSHCPMKHSVSLSNCKYPVDQNNTWVSQYHSIATVPKCTSTSNNDGGQSRNISMAQDLILQEKLRISINEERRIVIQYIETNRLRGVPVDAFVMNLICFKCYDNFEISNSMKRDECRSIIEQIDQEIEKLKQKLTQAQNHLLLITTFDSMPQ